MESVDFLFDLLLPFFDDLHPMFNKRSLDHSDGIDAEEEVLHEVEHLLLTGIVGSITAVSDIVFKPVKVPLEVLLLFL